MKRMVSWHCTKCHASAKDEKEWVYNGGALLLNPVWIHAASRVALMCIVVHCTTNKIAFSLKTIVPIVEAALSMCRSFDHCCLHAARITKEKKKKKIIIKNDRTRRRIVCTTFRSYKIYTLKLFDSRTVYTMKKKKKSFSAEFFLFISMNSIIFFFERIRLFSYFLQI